MTAKFRWVIGSVAFGLVAASVALYLFQPWRLWTDREVQDALPPSPVVVASGPAAPAEARIVRQGTFLTHEHDTSGTAQLVRLADGRHQLVLRDLATSDGPDLRVWLTDREVLPGRKGWGVFDDGRHVEIAPLKGNRGNQVYDIPAAVDLDGLRSVSIWCRRFAVSFGAAELINT